MKDASEKGSQTMAASEKGSQTMAEARASWTMRYLSRDGFDMMITLRDDEEATLSERVAKVVAGVIKAGGKPIAGRAPATKNEEREEKKEGHHGHEEEENGATYVDENGVRRCNRPTVDGGRCGAVVTEREGKYGTFWACPRYREHAK